MKFGLIGRLLLVGAGKMGGALLDGWIAAGLSPEKVTVLDPNPPADVVALLSKHGLVARAGPVGSGEVPELIVLAVKPQVMDSVLDSIADLAGPETLVLSIAAGRTIESFERRLRIGTAVVRAMPNTPAAIGRGMTVCVANKAASDAQRLLATSLLSSVGEVAWVNDEGKMDAVTAVSGSGPAYVFLLAECLASAGVEAGLAPDLARRLARATVVGSGTLLEQSGLDAADLRNNVTSPGGTTAAALEVLMGESGLGPLLARAVAAATCRSRELSG